MKDWFLPHFIPADGSRIQLQKGCNLIRFGRWTKTEKRNVTQTNYCFLVNLMILKFILGLYNVELKYCPECWIGNGVKRAVSSHFRVLSVYAAIMEGLRKAKRSSRLGQD
jgi:hypothetical protein